MSKDSKKKQLGKGIRALLNNMEEEETRDRAGLSRELSKSVAEIPIEWIEANPHQPRKDFEPEAIRELAESIKVHGIIQPLTLRRLSSNSYQIIAGERRYRASRLAGLKEVPAYVRLADDQTLLEMALVENIQREDLNALEVAFSMNRLIRECELTHDELSSRLGKDRSTVTNYLRLLKLPPEIQQAVRDKVITMGHARALAGISELTAQLLAYRRTVEQSWSVRKLEEYLRNQQGGSGSSLDRASSELHPEIKRIQDELSGHFGSKVAVKRTAKGSGSIVIHFRNDSELNDILDIIHNEE